MESALHEKKWPNSFLLLFLGMSENYVIFIEQPALIKLWEIITANFSGESFLDGLSWEPQLNTRFYVVNKHTGQVGPLFGWIWGLPDTSSLGSADETVALLILGG